jgi:lipopolysaccharide export system protein LptA
MKRHPFANAPNRLRQRAMLPLRSLAWRSLTAGFAAGGALLAGAGWIAQAQGVSGFNSNAPVNYSADRIELQDRQNRVVLSGNVDIAQGDLRLNAARTTVAYTDNGSLAIQRIDATGGVRVNRGNESARGDVAIYDFNRRIITMIGNVGLRRGNDTLNGGRLVIDLNSGVSSVDGRAGGSSSALGTSTGRGGRVSGSFSVPKKN